MSKQPGLELHLQYLGELCRRAITLGWQSGRIGFSGADSYPFQSEVAAILNASEERVREQLAEITARIEELSQRLAFARSVARQAASAAASDADCSAAQPADGYFARVCALVQRFGLSELAVEILFIIAAPRLWGELARLYGIITNDPARALCDELLVCQLLGVPASDRWQIGCELSPESALLSHGLVRVQEGDRPFCALTVDPIIIDWLQGQRLEEVASTGPIELLPAAQDLEQLILPASLLKNILRELDGFPRNVPLRLVLRGRIGSGRRSLLAALAERQGARLGLINLALVLQDRVQLEERLRGVLRQVALRGWLPCLDCAELALDDAARDCLRQVLRRYPGPVFVRSAIEQQTFLEPGYLQYELPPITELQRGELFRAALLAHGLPAGAADSLAAKYRIGPGTIHRVVAQVAKSDQEAAAAAPKRTAIKARLEEAIRQHRGSRIGALATPVTRLATWDQVVLPDDLTDSIREFISRIRFRRKVYEQWGMDQIMSSSRGFTALFQGGPGTGKSMVAGLIASELGYDLYRVDVSRILSRWIGETEQNLAQLFDAAEDGQAIILFDEADALFTKRTEVKTSVDRYANVQVNYLLQRLDAFEGIAILTSNQGTAIDAAFKRRLSMRLTFPFPNEEMRRDLWRAHLPATLPILEPLDLELLADSYELSGGYIRNAVLRAAFLAARDGTAVSQRHLERAVRLEYQEAGKLCEVGVLE